MERPALNLYWLNVVALESAVSVTCCTVPLLNLTHFIWQTARSTWLKQLFFLRVLLASILQRNSTLPILNPSGSAYCIFYFINIQSFSVLKDLDTSGEGTGVIFTFNILLHSKIRLMEVALPNTFADSNSCQLEILDATLFLVHIICRHSSTIDCRLLAFTSHMVNATVLLLHMPLPFFFYLLASVIPDTSSQIPQSLFNHNWSEV